MENHEIGQIVEHTLDSGKKRIVALRTDGMLLLWNWEVGEWTAFMSPSAAEAKGLPISPALLQAGRKAGHLGGTPPPDRARPSNGGAYTCFVCGVDHGHQACPQMAVTADRIPDAHVDRDPRRGRISW